MIDQITLSTYKTIIELLEKYPAHIVIKELKERVEGSENEVETTKS